MIRFVWAGLKALLAETMIFLVRCYQYTLSPIMGQQCRFQPTCSNYYILAVRKYGPFRGAFLGIYRILRCNPLCKGGFDPP